MTDTFQKYGYAWFHFRLIGKEFIENKTGKNRTKLFVWCKYQDYPVILDRLIKDEFKEYCLYNKEGWNS